MKPFQRSRLTKLLFIAFVLCFSLKVNAAEIDDEEVVIIIEEPEFIISEIPDIIKERVIEPIPEMPEVEIEEEAEAEETEVFSIPELAMMAAEAAPDMDEVATVGAKTIWAEARNDESTDAERLAVVLTFFNRILSGDPYYPTDFVAAVKQPHQSAYYASAPVTKEFYELAKYAYGLYLLREEGVDVSEEWVLPLEYTHYCGRDGHNHFYYLTKGGRVYHDPNTI